MKKLLIILFIFSSNAFSNEFSFSPIAFSYHFKASKNLQYIHPGLAFDYKSENGWYWQNGFFQNSVGKPLLFSSFGIYVGPLRMGNSYVKYTGINAKYNGLLPHFQLEIRQFYMTFIPAYGYAQPYPTIITSYGFSLK